MKVTEFPAINQLMDEGLKKEIALEAKVWNERLYKKKPYKGGELDRFPLSPSQIGKCGLALARNMAHYMGLADYPRTDSFLEPRIKRIFGRGHLIEEGLLGDITKFTPLKVTEQQKRLKLFEIAKGKWIEGNIDSLFVHEVDGVKILADIKSKGAYYSAGFKDSIDKFFQEMKQTGFVEELHENCFYITNAKGLFDIISLDEFFVDYLLQLNAYAFALREEGTKVDFVSLYYENKNTCANYEVRWVPHQALFDYAKAKFQFIYDTVTKSGAEAVPKEFALGSARCRLCDYNELCWGKYEPKSDAQKGKIIATIPESLEAKIKAAFLAAGVMGQRNEEEVIKVLDEKDATHAQLASGMVFEKKFLKTPKPHYELRQVSK
jgi:CRISPR/Cas system-associated exonuclease Cas4 (RecB family)